MRVRPIFIHVIHLLFLGVLYLCAPGMAAAQYLSLEEFATGLTRPVSIVNAGDGSGRLYFVLQGGSVVLHDGNEVLPTPFLDISSLVSCCAEQGLLDIAFHPNYAGNGLFFVSYTDTSGASVIARYRVSSNPLQADPGSAAVLLRVAQPFTSHNAGQIQFGPDGFLYVALGDGGSGGDPDNRAQDLGDLLGKILRIQVGQGPGYAIPASNPFVGVAGARGEIWSLGLRNPWRFSFDRQTGDLLIGDVGQGKREEVNFQKAGHPGGENYGWRLMEGSICFIPTTGCNDGTLVLPVIDYEHLDGNCSITGGYRYRGGAVPRARGLYFYADFCSGRLWVGAEDVDGSWTSTEVLDTDLRISTFGEDESGRLYIADIGHGAGTIYRLVLQDALGDLQAKATALPWLPLLLD